MNVLINAITITDGGGVVVLNRLLEFMHQKDPNISWYITAETKVLSYLSLSDKMIGIPCSWARKSPLHLLYWYEVELPKILSQVKANLCFSHTNFLSRRRLPCPSFLLVHNAGFFSDLFTQLQLQCYTSLKDAFLWKQKIKWAYYSIKHATAVTVQTKTLADKIIARLNISPEKIFTIPHGIGLLNNIHSIARTFPTETSWRIGYITKFGVQKDFDTAIKALSLLKQARIPIKLILTLDSKMKEYSRIAQKIQQYDVEDRVENVGDITDLFIFPSIIESFGFTLVEAMANGLPIIVADSDSNREVAGIAGRFFPLRDDKNLAAMIMYFMNNQYAYCLASKNSLERVRNFCWDKTAVKLINVIHQLITSNSRVQIR